MITVCDIFVTLLIIHEKPVAGQATVDKGKSSEPFMKLKWIYRYKKKWIGDFKMYSSYCATLFFLSSLACEFHLNIAACSLQTWWVTSSPWKGIQNMTRLNLWCSSLHTSNGRYVLYSPVVFVFIVFNLLCLNRKKSIVILWNVPVLCADDLKIHSKQAKLLKQVIWNSYNAVMQKIYNKKGRIHKQLQQ